MIISCLLQWTQQKWEDSKRTIITTAQVKENNFIVVFALLHFNNCEQEGKKGYIIFLKIYIFNWHISLLG